MSTDQAILKVRGQKYEGWTAVTVEKSLTNLAGAFGLAATDIYPGNAEKWGIAMGDECTVEINGQIVITGYVEDIPISYDAGSHNIQIGGRDKTGDLVDCSFNETDKEWKNQTVQFIIEQLCSPFNVTVVVDSSVETQASAKIETFKANEGDVVFDLIAKLCRMKAILPVSYGDGKLTLTRAGTVNAYDTLEFGVNVKAGHLDQSNKDRFQTYIVKGQGLGSDDKTELEVYTGPKGTAQDDVITRYRPLIIFAEVPCDEGKCLERAQWERNMRGGKSRSIEYEVQGWTQSNGVVWPLNGLVRVKDNFLQIDSTLLIAELSFVVDDQSGTITRMLLADPAAFELIEELQEAEKKTKGTESGFDWMS